MTLTIYTDGACEPNPGKGGWAFVAYSNGNEVYYETGGDVSSTNNIMEMTGVLRALEWLRDELRVTTATIYSDSQYVVKGCTIWRHGWKRKGWKRGQNAELANADLWREISALLDGMNVTIKWVKGHAGILGNERADELSQIGREQAIEANAAPDLIAEQLRYEVVA